MVEGLQMKKEHHQFFLHETLDQLELISDNILN
jgi:hypothetical protein